MTQDEETGVMAGALARLIRTQTEAEEADLIFAVEKMLQALVDNAWKRAKREVLG